MLKILKKYRWPGNEAELRSCIERSVNRLTSESIIEVHHLPEYIVEAVNRYEVDCYSAPSIRLKDRVLAYEKSLIESALQQNGWKREATAADLGIDVSTLWRKMTTLGIDDPGLPKL